MREVSHASISYSLVCTIQKMLSSIVFTYFIFLDSELTIQKKKKRTLTTCHWIYLLSVSVFLIGRFFLSGFGLIKIMWGTASGSIFVPLGMLHLCGSEVQGSSAGTSVSPINCQLLRAVINPTRWEQVSPLLKIEQVITWINVQNRKVPFRREVGWIMCHSPGSRTTNIYSPSRVKLTTI